MFRLLGVCDSIKPPPGPPIEKGGNAYTPSLLIVAIGVKDTTSGLHKFPL